MSYNTDQVTLFKNIKYNINEVTDVHVKSITVLNWYFISEKKGLNTREKAGLIVFVIWRHRNIKQCLKCVFSTAVYFIFSKWAALQYSNISAFSRLNILTYSNHRLKLNDTELFQLQFYPSDPSLSSILPFPRMCIYHLLHLSFLIFHFFHSAISPQEKELKSLFSCSLISSYSPFHISFSYTPYLSISFHTRGPQP